MSGETDPKKRVSLVRDCIVLEDDILRDKLGDAQRLNRKLSEELQQSRDKINEVNEEACRNRR